MKNKINDTNSTNSDVMTVVAVRSSQCRVEGFRSRFSVSVVFGLGLWAGVQAWDVGFAVLQPASARIFVSDHLSPGGNH